MNRAPGAGSRARTRELGYADGMREMWELLRAGEKSWREAELRCASDGDMGAAEFMGQVGAWLGKYADYAFRTWLLHDDYLGRFARDVEHLAYLEHKGYCAPPLRELAGQEADHDRII